MAASENSTPEMRDIDAVIQAVRQQMPTVSVTQLQKRRANDDDNFWWFALPNVKQDVQVEHSSCPFLIETNEQSSKDALKAMTVQEAADMIVIYLTAAKEGCSCRLEGQLWWPE